LGAAGCAREQPTAPKHPLTLPTAHVQVPQAAPPAAKHVVRHDPNVGSKLPNFVLRDQTGKKRSLQEFLGRGKVVLVFFRSATW
jgi:hypothetical protein